MTINLESVQWWLQFILAIIAVVTTIGAPLMMMLKKYRKALSAACEGTEKVQAAVLTLIKVKLDQICNDILLQGWITVEQLENLELLFDSYHNCGGNHGMKNKVDRCRQLPVRRDENGTES